MFKCTVVVIWGCIFFVVLGVRVRVEFGVYISGFGFYFFRGRCFLVTRVRG